MLLNGKKIFYVAFLYLISFVKIVFYKGLLKIVFKYNEKIHNSIYFLALYQYQLMQIEHNPILFYGPKQAEFGKLFPGVVNEVPDPLFILISATALIILWVITFDKMGIANFKNGSIITGIWFGALTFTFFGFQFMALTNIVSIQSLL